MAVLSAGIGGIAAALIAGSLLLVSFGLARRLLPELPISVRWSGTLGIALWIPVALFWLLVPLGGFRRSVVLPSLACLVLVAVRQGWLASDDLRALREDGARVARFLARRLRRPAGWVLFLPLAVAAVRCLRGSGSPPLGWDALTYHLLRAGRWVQAGGLAPEVAPDAWGYYEHYPFTGDVLWSWVMLPVRGDALLTLAGTAIWLAILLGCYAAARSLDARPRNALLAAGALGACPSVLTYLSSGYVDSMSLATFLLASVFVVRLARGAALREAPLAAGLLGLMLGIKTIMAPLFFLAALVLAVRCFGGGRGGRRWIALSLLAVSVGAPGYLKAWAEKGSPIYPFGLEIAGRAVFEGNEEVALVSSGEHLAARHHLGSPFEAVAYLFFRRTREGAFVNPGPGAPLIVLLGLFGSAVLLRRRERRSATAYLVLSALVPVALFFSGYMEFSRTTIYVTTAGRFLMPALGACAVLGAAVGGRFPLVLWSFAVALGALWSRPMAWAAVERPMMIATTLLAAGGVAVGIGLWRASGRRLRAAFALAALAAIGAWAAGLTAVRERYRYPIWAAATNPKQPVFHSHRLHPLYAAAWPLWRHFDDGRPHRLAVTGGWDGQGHNWYRYPLMGSQLQNEVRYYPITADGSVVDYRLREAAASTASFTAWLSRLWAAEVDAVVSLAPRNTVEDRWLVSAGRVFTLEVEDPAALHAAFRVAPPPTEGEAPQ